MTMIIMLGIPAISCSENAETDRVSSETDAKGSPISTNTAAPTKISSLLQLQISLRREQLANPTPERLAQMQALGMNVTDIGVQRIFIYLNQQLNPTQTDELQNLGIILYTDSWIPPVASHPAGFILADMPVDKLESLASKDYIVRLDTAEVQAQPQNIPLK
jgi:hypothetical protein